VRGDRGDAGAGGAVERGAAAVGVEADERAQEGAGVLAMPGRIAVYVKAAVAEGDVEVAPAAGPFGRAELELAGIVAVEGLGDLEKGRLAVGVGHVRVIRRDAEAGDDEAERVRRGVADVEVP